MRYIAVGIATAFIVMMGLTLRPGPQATAAIDAPTLSDPGAMYPKVDVNKLPVAEHVDAY
jgi:hypothetical protein